MGTHPSLLVLYAILTWLLLVGSSLIRVRSWTWPGMKIAFGNRDAVPDATGFAGRTERCAHNSLENLVLFAALLFAAKSAGASAGTLDTAAAVFVGARVVYTVVYLIGVPVLRTAVWAVSIVGLGMLAVAALR